MKIIIINLDTIMMPNWLAIINTQVKLNDSLIQRPDSREFKMIIDFIRLEIHMSEAFKKPNKKPVIEWLKCFRNLKKRNGSTIL